MQGWTEPERALRDALFAAMIPGDPQSGLPPLAALDLGGFWADLGRAAPLLQVLTTCLHAQRLVNIFPGESVVVLGLGVTGQLHVQLAKARGAAPVIGVSRSARLAIQNSG